MIKFCERKIAAAVSGSGGRGGRHLADTESYVLLWQMLVLLLRQKGQVLCVKVFGYMLYQKYFFNWKIFRWRAVTWRSFCCVTVRLIPRIQVTTAAAVSRTGAGRPGENTEL